MLLSKWSWLKPKKEGPSLRGTFMANTARACVMKTGMWKILPVTCPVVSVPSDLRIFFLSNVIQGSNSYLPWCK